MSTEQEHLVPFLRELAGSVEKQELTPKQLKSIGQFFMSYKFQEQAEKDENVDVDVNEEFSKKELINFIVLGWYIYTMILKEKTIES